MPTAEPSKSLEELVETKLGHFKDEQKSSLRQADALDVGSQVT